MDYIIHNGKKFELSTIYVHYGLERTPLKCLELRHKGINSIDEVEGLSELTEIEYLDLRENNISDMRGLGELTNLKVLFVGNRISEKS